MPRTAATNERKAVPAGGAGLRRLLVRASMRAFTRNDPRQMAALEAVMLEDPPISFGAAAELSGLPKTTVYRLVAQFRTVLARLCEEERVEELVG